MEESGMGEMDQFELASTLSGFEERMSKVALFDPLFELRRKKQSDENGQPIDMMEVGLLSLLFFFEQKLMRNTRVGVKELTLYLSQVLNYKFVVDSSKCEDLARDIIQVFRPASGKRREFTFLNWETQEHQTVFTSILKANAFDSKTNTQFYALDEDGLELVFATKEFYSEFQLSIHQLVLRKQLEKGEFQGALRQINEMRVDVESLQTRMIKLEHEIKRSIVSEDTLKRYSGLLEDVYTRLQRENEEFDELRQFVKETMARLYADMHMEKQENAYEYILRISNELEKVHAEHTGLLQKSIELKNQALHSAKESLYYTGLNSFNFEQDIAAIIFGFPLPLESMKGIVAPFIGLEQFSDWSLLTLFSEQNTVGSDEHQSSKESFLEANTESEETYFLLQRGAFFAEIMQVLIEQLNKQQEIELLHFIEQLHDSELSGWLDHRSFYDFWLILHQRSPIMKQSISQNDEGKTGLEEVFDLLGNRTLIIVEASGFIDIGTRYQIQNMKLRWGEE